MYCCCFVIIFSTCDTHTINAAVWDFLCGFWGCFFNANKVLFCLKMPFEHIDWMSNICNCFHSSSKGSFIYTSSETGKYILQHLIYQSWGISWDGTNQRMGTLRWFNPAMQDKCSTYRTKSHFDTHSFIHPKEGSSTSV